MLDYVIRIKNISKTFDTSTKKIIGNSGFSKIRAIDNISLDIEKGKVVGIIGRNGSGKTTLLRLIAGILYSDHRVCKCRSLFYPCKNIPSN